MSKKSKPPNWSTFKSEWLENSNYKVWLKQVKNKHNGKLDEYNA